MKVVTTAMQVLEEISEAQPAGVSSVARSLNLPKSTVQRALVALEAAGWIMQSSDDDARWVLTTRALKVGSHVGGHLVDRQVALPVMRRVNDETLEAVHLNILDGHEVVLIERLDSKHFIRAHNPIGARAPLHTTSNGKAILAAWSDAQLEEYVRLPLARRTDATIVDPDQLRAAIADVRAVGYATSIGELLDDVSAVGAAIFGRDGQPIGSMSISAPAHRITESVIPRYGQIIVEATGEISTAIGGARRTAATRLPV